MCLQAQNQAIATIGNEQYQMALNGLQEATNRAAQGINENSAEDFQYANENEAVAALTNLQNNNSAKAHQSNVVPQAQL